MCIDANTVLKYNHIDCGTLELLFIKTQKVIFTLLLQIYNYEHFFFYKYTHYLYGISPV